MQNDKINDEALSKMFDVIRKAENKNIKTQEYDDNTMVDRITKFIERNIQLKEGKK